MRECTCQMPTAYYSPEGAKGHCTCGALHEGRAGHGAQGDPATPVPGHETPRPPVWPDDFRGFGSNVRPRKQK